MNRVTTQCRRSVLAPHSIPMATWRKVLEAQGGELEGDWARAWCHCSIKKPEGVSLDSTKRGARKERGESFF